MSVRTVSLFRNGRNQAVRIPKEFELPGKEATIRREGASVVIEPIKNSLVEYLLTKEPLDEDLPEIYRSPPRPVDL